jgi:hypothetical protein
MAFPSDLSFTETLTSARRAAFYEGHKSVAVVMILIVFLFPFIGVFLRGLVGAVGGVVLSVLCYYLAPFLILALNARTDR